MATVSSLGEHGPSHVPRLGHAPDWKRSNVSAPASSKKTARAPDPSSDDDLVIMVSILIRTISAFGSLRGAALDMSTILAEAI